MWLFERVGLGIHTHIGQGLPTKLYSMHCFLLDTRPLNIFNTWVVDGLERMMITYTDNRNWNKYLLL